MKKSAMARLQTRNLKVDTDDKIMLILMMVVIMVVMMMISMMLMVVMMRMMTNLGTSILFLLQERTKTTQPLPSKASRKTIQTPQRRVHLRMLMMLLLVMTTLSMMIMMSRQRSTIMSRMIQLQMTRIIRRDRPLTKCKKCKSFVS